MNLKKFVFVPHYCNGIDSLPSHGGLLVHVMALCDFNFPTIMKRDRFSLILKILHLNDNQRLILKGQPGHYLVHKIRPFMDKVLEIFDPFSNQVERYP